MSDHVRDLQNDIAVIAVAVGKDSDSRHAVSDSEEAASRNKRVG